MTERSTIMWTEDQAVEHALRILAAVIDETYAPHNS
jgi:hypothetical protein